jgi:hypothetical protein
MIAEASIDSRPLDTLKVRAKPTQPAAASPAGNTSVNTRINISSAVLRNEILPLAREKASPHRNLTGVKTRPARKDSAQDVKIISFEPRLIKTESKPVDTPETAPRFEVPADVKIEELAFYLLSESMDPDEVAAAARGLKQEREMGLVAQAV